MSKLYFRYGAMNSGKSTHLMQVAYNYEERHMKILLLKPETDKKGGEYLVSRLGVKRKVDILVGKDVDVFKEIEKRQKAEGEIHCILVDEVQFMLKKQIDQLFKVAVLLDIPVICYGLRTDFQTHLFEGTKRLFEIADSLEEIKSSCECGHKCIFNARVDSDGNIIEEGEQIEIGGNERYVSMCRKCFNEKINSQYYTDGRGKDSVL